VQPILVARVRQARLRPYICDMRRRELAEPRRLGAPCPASVTRRSPTSRGRRAVALLAIVGAACGGGSRSAGSADDLSDPMVARYRLPLRYNPVDPGQAFRCYGGCQAETSPQGYLQCLGQCPGFEVTQGVRCADDEVPPLAACFTVRQISASSEPSPGWVVLAVIANVALIVTLASVCASASSQCGYGYSVAPGPLPPY